MAPEQVMRVAVGLILLQLAVRAWVAARGNFYWDDLILTGRGGSMPLLSSKFLLYDHDGHFSPGAFLAAGVMTRLAPLRWGLPLASLVVLQTVASLSVLRLLRVLLGWRPALLAPLLIYLFSPLTLPSYAWWSAALNALPMQAGMAWMAADALRLSRSGSLRYAVSGTFVFAVSLSFFEKAVLVPLVAFAVVALVLRIDGQDRPFVAAARSGAALWTSAVVLIGFWAWLYTSAVRSHSARAEDLGHTVDMLARTASRGLLPALLGGPWSWGRLGVSTPWATPPTVLVFLGWLSLLAAIAGTVLWKRRVGWVWVFATTYVATDLALMVVGRSSPLTPLELGQTLRYVADSSVVVVIAVALVVRAPPRPAQLFTHLATVRLLSRPAIAVAVGAAFVAGCLWSTVTFTRLWSDNPTAGYLATARASLAANKTTPMLDQPVAEDVLFRLAYPNNLASKVFSPLEARPAFVSTTPVLRMIDPSGWVVSAYVAPARAVRVGPVRQCGYRVQNGPVTTLPLDGPLFDWDWTVQLNYLAASPGRVQVALQSGRSVSVPVTAGLHQAFVRLVGGGREVRVTETGPDPALCVISADVGLVRVTPHGAAG